MEIDYGKVMKKVLAILPKGEQEDYTNRVLAEGYFDEILEILLENFIQAQKSELIVEDCFSRYVFNVKKEEEVDKVIKMQWQFAIASQKRETRIFRVADKKVAVEIPNDKKRVVALEEVLSADIPSDGKDGLYCSIGRALGQSVYCDLSTISNMLVAGGTGSGKSIFIHQLIVSLIARYSPKELKLILVDPKMVGFRIYNDLPHLGSAKTFYSDTHSTINLLEDLLEKSFSRLNFFKKHNVKDIGEFNQYAEKNGLIKMKRIVLIIDEFSDLMYFAGEKFEELIYDLTLKGRAAGIHLILTTQLPNDSVITPLLRSNCDCKIVFKAYSTQDPFTTIGFVGADKLMGNGDVLFKDSTMENPIRAQVCFIDSSSLGKIVEAIKEEW